MIESNSAIYGGGIYAYAINYSTKYPGQMIISKSKIQNNIASNGGGVYASYSKDVKLSDCALNGNGAHYGGGILTSNSTIAFGTARSAIIKRTSVVADCMSVVQVRYHVAAKVMSSVTIQQVIMQQMFI